MGEKHWQFDCRLGSLWVGLKLTRWIVGLQIGPDRLVLGVGPLYVGVGYLFGYFYDQTGE